jgi:hypothetical protein
MRNPKIVAFLEEPWFEINAKRDGVFKYRTDQEYHQHLLKSTAIGFKLLNVFGPSTFANIFWSCIRQDSIHVEQVLEAQKPDLIICFGPVVEKAMERSLLAEKIPWLSGHDPLDRSKSLEDLNAYVISVSEWCDEWKISGGEFKWIEILPPPILPPKELRKPEQKKRKPFERIRVHYGPKPWELKKYI